MYDSIIYPFTNLCHSPDADQNEVGFFQPGWVCLEKKIIKISTSSRSVVRSLFYQNNDLSILWTLMGLTYIGWVTGETFF